MDIENRKLLTEEEFKKMREYILKSSYKEIKENIFSKYWANNIQFKELNNLWKISLPFEIEDDEKISKIRYLYEHVNSNYWNLSYNLKWTINDSYVTMVDYNWYIFSKMNSLRLSFILWLAFWDSIKQFWELIYEKKLYKIEDKNIKNIIDKYSDFNHKKENTKYLDFSEFKSFPIFDEKKWKMTFRDFANDLKHNDDLLINLQYELLMKHTIKERFSIEEKDWKKCNIKKSGWIKTNMDDFNEFYYWICVNNLIEATNDLVVSVNFILKYFKKNSKLKDYFQ